MRSCGQGKSGEYPNVKCPRCLIEEEKWEHIWILLNEVVDKELVEIEKEDILKFKERVLSSAKFFANSSTLSMHEANT
ncbi:hypothetical protein RIR_jg185.t1 [Rhizophagus irregularis DAOM 181602=DAOM 197198]|nr:hypothetical protein RIR_jg185.t1 [Rhizophagus irregularis DAOM 181602=DAOM 197198]